MTDHPNVARPVSEKLKREAKTLSQALGAVITRFRTRKKWSQGLLARMSGYELTTINRLERGKGNPTMQAIVVMADIFGLRPSQLLALAERKQRKEQGKGGAPIPKDKA